MAASRNVERQRTLEMERQREQKERQLKKQQWERDFATQVAGNAGFLPSHDETINQWYTTSLASPTRPVGRPSFPNPPVSNHQRNNTAPNNADIKPITSKVRLFFS